MKRDREGKTASVPHQHGKGPSAMVVHSIRGIGERLDVFMPEVATGELGRCFMRERTPGSVSLRG